MGRFLDDADRINTSPRVVRWATNIIVIGSFALIAAFLLGLIHP